MRILYVVAAAISTLQVSGTAPPSTTAPPKQRRGMSRRNPIVKRRDAIVESVYLAHPEWTSARVFEAVE